MEYNELFASVRRAGLDLQEADDARINLVLNDIADQIALQSDHLLAENRKDLDRMSPDNPKYDRLQLTASRLQAIAADTRHVASLPSPLGRVLKQQVLPNGLRLRRVSVPFGVIGIIYEARPNVSFDVSALCLKSGNACLLKGGSDAHYSNLAIIQLIREVLQRNGINPDAVTLLPSDHEAAHALLHARGYVDLLIPRGGRGLIDFVRQNATIPVIETGAGICHTYFDREGRIDWGAAIIENAKTRRVSVCNALDCLLIHRDRLADLPQLCQGLAAHQVLIYADEEAFRALQGHYPDALLQPSTPESYGTEFLDYKMAIKCVGSADEAIDHIARYGSHHSECIVTDNADTATRFARRVDAACIYHNAPTSFTDGAQFGLGAEIGISTQKLHARGPMALEELTTYKWLIEGEGQTRPS